MSQKQITVFSPTYNRAYCLDRLYKSLVEQSNQNFIWLVIDDGSIDNTKELIKSWIDENRIEIEYIYQENQGMHGAHNTAYRNITTAYNVCIDSDDYMPKNAIKNILEEIENIDKDDSYAGIVGLDATEDGRIIGTPIPDFLEKVKLNELYTIHKVKGDKKLVYKTNIIKNTNQYPLFEGEKFVPLDYKYLLIDQEFFLKPVNKIFCIVEYMSDGSTKNIFTQYQKNPRGFAFSRLSRIKLGRTFVERFKNSIHLVSSSIFAKDISLLIKSPRPILTLTAVPFGLALNIYIRLKQK